MLFFNFQEEIAGLCGGRTPAFTRRVPGFPSHMTVVFAFVKLPGLIDTIDLSY